MGIRKKTKAVYANDATVIQYQALPADRIPPNYSYTAKVSDWFGDRLCLLEDIEYDTTGAFDKSFNQLRKKLTKKNMWKYYAVRGYKLVSCNCTHEVYRSAYTDFVNHPSTRVRSVSGNGNNTYWMRDMSLPEACSYALQGHVFYGDLHRYARPAIQRITDSKIEDWCRRAVDACSDVLSHEAGRSAETAQFLYELKDLRRTLIALRSPLKSLLRFAGDLTVKGWRQSVKTVAGQHLNVSFNVLPMISDVQDIYRVLTRFADAMHQLEQNAGRDLVFHWRPPSSEYAFDDPAPDQVESLQRFTGGAERRSFKRTARIIKMDVNFTIHYSYSLPADFASTKTQILLAMDALGINANPKILWDEIPFSFVLDWFVRIGDWLEKNFAIRNVHFPVVMTDCCYTVKCYTVYDFLGGYWGFSGPTEPSQASAYTRPMFTSSGRGSNTVFIRRRWCPRPGWISLAAGKPGISQILLGTSLLATHGL